MVTLRHAASQPKRKAVTQIACCNASCAEQTFGLRFDEVCRERQRSEETFEVEEDERAVCDELRRSTGSKSATGNGNAHFA